MPATQRLLAYVLQAAARGDQAQKASADLLLIVKLFTRLAQSSATIGQDVLRVKHMMHHIENAEEGADALDLACQTADALCQLQNPSVELLGTPPVASCTLLIEQCNSSHYIVLQDSCHHFDMHPHEHVHGHDHRLSGASLSSVNLVSAFIQPLFRPFGVPAGSAG